VKENFVGVVHEEEITATYLKSCVDALLAELCLSIIQIRGQGYDGASNMSGEFNGSKAKIMREQFSILCALFCSQTAACCGGQLAIAKKIFYVRDFFDMISILLNVVGSSWKRKDKLEPRERV
jgi:hypothetical protein